MDQICARCGSTLQPIDDAPPAFCGVCGLPQLRISQDAVALPQGSAESGAVTSFAAATGTHLDDGISWTYALRAIAVAAVAGVVPASLLPGALTDGVVGGLSLLLLPVLTLGVVSIYHRGRPRRAISAAIGARLGAALGMCMGGLIAFLTGAAGFVLRYGYHSRVMDEKILQATAQMPAGFAGAGPPPPELLAFIHSPEFLAGSFIMSYALWMVVLVIIGSVCGWMSGTMLRVRRQRRIG